MANHRPKSLSELNNVYDKAMRAERAIKEGSSLLSIPEPEISPESENIFQQLEHKAAEAHKNQVFDPDITNIANDFLKRYAQPEKPKVSPQEIKRPAPSIQVYHTPVKEPEAKPNDIPLNMGTDFASTFSAPSAPVHKPAHTVPSTESVKPAVSPEVQQTPAEPKAPAPQVKKVVASSAGEKATDKKSDTASLQTEKRFDHTPRPAASRVRITSTERSELMEEYMRVMSDDDDEPSYKKSMFSFFKKKKKYDDEETDDMADLYENYSDDSDEDSAEEIPVVPFDSSDVQYENEYSNAPESISEDIQLNQEPMNLSDYIEADFDDEESAENDEDAMLDVSFMSGSSVHQELSYEEDTVEASELVLEDTTEEAEQTEELSVEENISVTEDQLQEDANDIEEEIVYPEEINDEAELETAPEEAVYPDAPPSDMVFEDIFSVTDESKRSHTGGNWTEVFTESPDEDKENSPEEFVITPIEEVLDDSSAEDVVYPTEEAEYAEDTEEAEEVIYADYQEDDSQTQSQEIIEEDDDSDAPQSYDDTEDVFDDYDAPKKHTGLKIVMAIAAVLCLAFAGITAVVSTVLDVNSGKLFSEKYRAFSVAETIESIGLNKGDLVITENIFAQADDVYVFVNKEDQSYGFGKVTDNSTNLLGDYLYVSQTKDGIQLINRDTSMGVVTTTYGGIGSVASALCSYGIFITIALIILAVALIICLVIITRKRRLYEEASAIYDHRDSNNYDDNSTENSDENDNDEYYSDYDTDGIEQGLFNGI